MKESNETQNNQLEKLKKLEKFCNKLKSKKYRNCGSQTDNDENIEMIVPKKRQEICKSAFVDGLGVSINDQESKNEIY